jgi:C1A family cysteine protease
MSEIYQTQGAIISPPDVRDYRLASTILNFPREFELEMPPVKNQGSVGSCVAHSIALVMEFYNQKQHNEDIQMSVGYIYGNRVSSLHTGSGMHTREALKDACAEGSVPYTLFPFNKEVPEILEMVKKEKDNLFEKAQPYRFTSYVKVSTEEEIKTALYSGYPVVFAIKWYNDAKVKDGVLTSKQKDYNGSHCMVIYGWDDRGWKFQNSWGKLWGDGGCAILPYDFKITQAFSVIDELVGDIEIKKPFKSKTKFGKWVVRQINKICAFFYRMKYKIKY